MELDDRMVDAIRTKYQSDMKGSVAILSRMLKYNPYGSHVSDDTMVKIDDEISKFMMAKEKGTYFETIIKNLKVETGND